MSDTPVPGSDATDARIAALFARMRDSDALHAPEFPQQLMARSPVGVAPLADIAPARVAAAMAAAIFVAVIALPERQTPAALYSEVMGASRLITEEMIVASPDILPGLYEIPALYEAQMFVEPSSQIN